MIGALPKSGKKTPSNIEARNFTLNFMNSSKLTTASSPAKKPYKTCIINSTRTSVSP
jgi:hypothetical protein